MSGPKSSRLSALNPIWLARGGGALLRKRGRCAVRVWAAVTCSGREVVHVCYAQPGSVSIATADLPSLTRSYLPSHSAWLPYMPPAASVR